MTFLFIFLPAVLTLYLAARKELHNPILLTASIIFYAWGEPKYLAIMFLTVIINYIGALAIEKFYNRKKLILILTVLSDLSFLIYYKYFNFIISNLNAIPGVNFNTLDIIMPIGISFYTFQALSYVADVYKGECKAQKDIYKLSLYICLFPQLIAGPIVKYHDVSEQIDNRTVNFDKVDLGVKRFITGLAKKMLIANNMGLIADKIFAQTPDSFSHLTAWLGAFAYTFQIYFDFSGYSDMAIGLGLIFGFNFMENFNYPYISKSVTEFWRRWHISLSTWFKQYVYIPLGGNRCSKLKNVINLGIVFILTGIWHGANMTFIVWGIWHGFFIITEKLFNIKKFDEQKHSPKVNFLRHIYCIFAFMTGWVIFRADNIKYAKDYLMNMFGLMNINKENIIYPMSYYAGRLEIIVFLAAITLSIPIFKNFLYYKNKPLKAAVNIWLLFLLFLSVITMAANTYNPFIYFRF